MNENKNTASIDLDKLEALVREYGNTPLLGTGRTRDAVMADIKELARRSTSGSGEADAAGSERLTDEQYQEILRPVLSRYGMQRYLNGDEITLNPSDYRAIIDEARNVAATSGSEETQRVELADERALPLPSGGIDANKLEAMAKEMPDECFLKGSGVLKLIAAIRHLERAQQTVASADASIYAAGGIEDIADELEAEALNYEGDFADTVKGCVEALREIASRAAPSPSAEEERDAKDAARWRAFIGSSRIRPLGSAGLGEPMPGNYAHIGLEMWTAGDWGDASTKLGERLAAQTKLGAEWLIRYADVAIEAQRAAMSQAKTQGVA